MKNIIFAMAGLSTFAVTAQAQTSVMVYGSFDAGVHYANNQNSKGNSKLTMGSNGTFQTNRLGFKGVEDLGDGLNAHFTLEQGFNSGNGAQADSARLFNRGAFVGIGSQWGSLDMGRQFTVAYKTVAAYDPFNVKFSNIIPVAMASVAAGLRFDNDIQYTGTFGPFIARAEYALGEVTGGGNRNSAAALGGTYANGPISVGAAYTWRKPNVIANGFGAAVGATGSSFQDNRDWTVGGAYTFGPARIAVGYARETQDRNIGSSAQQKNAWVGGSYDIIPALALSAAYYDTKVENLALAANGSTTDGKRQLFIIGTNYALSKRTNLYADVDYTRFKNGLENVAAAANGGLGGGSQLPLASPRSSQAGVSVGIMHLF
jgi:predicted porin